MKFLISMFCTSENLYFDIYWILWLITAKTINYNVKCHNSRKVPYRFFYLMRKELKHTVFYPTCLNSCCCCHYKMPCIGSCERQRFPPAHLDLQSMVARLRQQSLSTVKKHPVLSRTQLRERCWPCQHGSSHLC